MLLQSYAGQIEVFPAIPAKLTNLSFDKLRAIGAFLVSAEMINGKVARIKITAEKGGKTRLKMPPGKLETASSKSIKASLSDDGYLNISASPGGYIILEAAQ